MIGFSANIKSAPFIWNNYEHFLAYLLGVPKWLHTFSMDTQNDCKCTNFYQQICEHCSNIERIDLNAKTYDYPNPGTNSMGKWSAR